ncbi:MAG: ArsA family ATPase [Solirubrobacterales bacterium]|nr:ArsA family ATPase [Solirubrobacterales bacterium]
MNVPELLAGKRVCVCAGSGGVGKTTTSAVIALGMAAQGLKVAVITIDPAKRLAAALGLEQLSNDLAQVPAERFAAAGLEVKGELWASMLDPKRTFDELIDAAAPTPERAGAIKENLVYQQISGAVAGSQEFTAVSKLYELFGDDRFDLIVLDTPPSRHALDFLEAPRRLNAFLEGRALQAFLKPTGVGLRMVGLGVAPLVGALKRITGVDLISDLTHFFGLLGPMTDTFSARARAVEVLLRSEATAFLLVTSAQDGPIAEASWFRDALEREGMAFCGAVVNRFHHDLSGGADRASVEAALAAALADPELAARVAENFADYGVLAARDEANLARLEADLRSQPVLPVPQFDSDIHDVVGLLRVHRFLFGSDSEREALIAGLLS